MLWPGGILDNLVDVGRGQREDSYMINAREVTAGWYWVEEPLGHPVESKLLHLAQVTGESPFLSVAAVSNGVVTRIDGHRLTFLSRVEPPRKTR
jgi:alkyl hydroperoxide reductase subunit AhpF